MYGLVVQRGPWQEKGFPKGHFVPFQRKEVTRPGNVKASGGIPSVVRKEVFGGASMGAVGQSPTLAAFNRKLLVQGTVGSQNFRQGPLTTPPGGGPEYVEEHNAESRRLALESMQARNRAMESAQAINRAREDLEKARGDLEVKTEKVRVGYGVMRSEMEEFARGVKREGQAFAESVGERLRVGEEALGREREGVMAQVAAQRGDMQLFANSVEERLMASNLAHAQSMGEMAMAFRGQDYAVGQRSAEAVKVLMEARERLRLEEAGAHERVVRHQAEAEQSLVVMVRRYETFLNERFQALNEAMARYEGVEAKRIYAEEAARLLPAVDVTPDDLRLIARNLDMVPFTISLSQRERGALALGCVEAFEPGRIEGSKELVPVGEMGALVPARKRKREEEHSDERKRQKRRMDQIYTQAELDQVNLALAARRVRGGDPQVTNLLQRIKLRLQGQLDNL